MVLGRLVRTVESHTGGMSTRVVIGGVATLPDATMEKGAYISLTRSTDPARCSRSSHEGIAP